MFLSCILMFVMCLKKGRSRQEAEGPVAVAAIQMSKVTSMRKKKANQKNPLKISFRLTKTKVVSASASKHEVQAKLIFFTMFFWWSKYFVMLVVQHCWLKVRMITNWRTQWALDHWDSGPFSIATKIPTGPRMFQLTKKVVCKIILMSIQHQFHDDFQIWHLFYDVIIGILVKRICDLWRALVIKCSTFTIVFL